MTQDELEKFKQGSGLIFVSDTMDDYLYRFATLVREETKDKAARLAYRVCVENRNEVIGDKVHESIKDMK